VSKLIRQDNIACHDIETKHRLNSLRLDPATKKHAVQCTQRLYVR